jgi:putative addiction module component (TIGR02574 family)
MPINKADILSLSAEEKIALAEELWSSVEEELLPVTEDEISFVKERLQMHEANPDEGISFEVFKKYFADKYGF